jgi:hypothetical protein
VNGRPRRPKHCAASVAKPAAHPRETPGLSTFGSGCGRETDSPRWSEMDSNFRFPELGEATRVCFSIQSVPHLGCMSYGNRPRAAVDRHRLGRVPVSAPPRTLLCSALPTGSSARYWHKWEESHELVTS